MGRTKKVLSIVYAIGGTFDFYFSTLTKFDGINYKIETIGTISNMKYSKNFEDTVTDFMSKVMDFIQEQKEFNKNQIDFNNKIMSLPTIKKELSELPKNKK